MVFDSSLTFHLLTTLKKEVIVVREDQLAHTNIKVSFFLKLLHPLEMQNYNREKEMRKEMRRLIYCLDCRDTMLCTSTFGPADYSDVRCKWWSHYSMSLYCLSSLSPLPSPFSLLPAPLSLLPFSLLPSALLLSRSINSWLSGQELRKVTTKMFPHLVISWEPLLMERPPPKVAPSLWITRFDNIFILFYFYWFFCSLSSSYLFLMFISDCF